MKLIFEKEYYNDAEGKTLPRYRPWNGTAKMLTEWKNGQVTCVLPSDLVILHELGCEIQYYVDGTLIKYLSGSASASVSPSVSASVSPSPSASATVTVSASETVSIPLQKYDMDVKPKTTRNILKDLMTTKIKII